MVPQLFRMNQMSDSGNVPLSDSMNGAVHDRHHAQCQLDSLICGGILKDEASRVSLDLHSVSQFTRYLMRLDIAPETSALPTYSPLPETQATPKNTQKNKSTDERAVLDQKIIDEYWNRRGTSDLEWAKSLAGGKLNKTNEAKSAAAIARHAEPPVIKAPPITSSADSAVDLSAEKADIENIEASSTEEIVDNLVTSTLQNLETLVQAKVLDCVSTGQSAFECKDVDQIHASAAELSLLLRLQPRLATLKKFVSNTDILELDEYENPQPIPEIPGLKDMVRYIGMRTESNDSVIVEATRKRDYALVENLARCGLKLSRLHRALLWLIQDNSCLDFSPN